MFWCLRRYTTTLPKFTMVMWKVQPRYTSIFLYVMRAWFLMTFHKEESLLDKPFVLGPIWMSHKFFKVTFWETVIYLVALKGCHQQYQILLFLLLAGIRLVFFVLLQASFAIRTGTHGEWCGTIFISGGWINYMNLSINVVPKCTGPKSSNTTQKVTRVRDSPI